VAATYPTFHERLEAYAQLRDFAQGKVEPHKLALLLGSM